MPSRKATTHPESEFPSGQYVAKKNRTRRKLQPPKKKKGFPVLSHSLPSRTRSYFFLEPSLQSHDCCQPPPKALYNWTNENSSLRLVWARFNSAANRSRSASSALSNVSTPP